MFAVVEIEGFQYEVKPEVQIKTQLIEGNPGDLVEFDKVLFLQDENDTHVGSPFVNAKVVASIVEHGKDDKVLVFKKKRRKGYRKLRGHRQPYTILAIKEISLS